MATSLSTLSHRLSLHPKPFNFSFTNKPISLSLPISPSPSLSLSKIHCSPPEAEDKETRSQDEEEEEEEGDVNFSVEDEDLSEEEETEPDEVDPEVVENIIREIKERVDGPPEETLDTFSGPLFDDTEEPEMVVDIGYELLYGAAFSGKSYLPGNSIYDMDKIVKGSYDKFGNLVQRRPKDEFEETLLELKRVTKVVKGGKNMGFRALMCVGDRKGHVGIGVASALEVSDAVVKSIINARRNIVTVPLTRNKTFYHKSIGKFGAASVILRPAAPGSGVVAGNTVRAILDLAGVENALGKQLGSKNRMNNARATIVATQMMRSWAEVSRQRGISVEEMWK